MEKIQFIEAYCYCYGASKKRAQEVYKTADKGYISAIIESMKTDSKKAFYND